MSWSSPCALTDCLSSALQGRREVTGGRDRSSLVVGFFPPVRSQARRNARQQGAAMAHDRVTGEPNGSLRRLGAVAPPPHSLETEALNVWLGIFSVQRKLVEDGIRL